MTIKTIAQLVAAVDALMAQVPVPKTGVGSFTELMQDVRDSFPGLAPTTGGDGRMYLSGDGTADGDAWIETGLLTDLDVTNEPTIYLYQRENGKNTARAEFSRRGINSKLMRSELNSFQLGRSFSIGTIGDGVAAFDLHDGEVHKLLEQKFSHDGTWGAVPDITPASSDILGVTATAPLSAVGVGLTSIAFPFAFAIPGVAKYILGGSFRIDQNLEAGESISIDVRHDDANGIRFWTHTIDGPVTAGLVQEVYANGNRLNPRRMSSGEPAHITMSTTQAGLTMTADSTEITIWAETYGVEYHSRNLADFRHYHDGENYALGEWVFDRVAEKIYKSNVDGAQSGTFAANQDLWSVLASLRDIDKAILGEDLEPSLKGTVERFGLLPLTATAGDIYKCLKRNATFFGRPPGYYQAVVTNPTLTIGALGWKKVSSASLPVYDAANDKDKYQQFTVNDVETVAKRTDRIVSPDTLKSLVITDTDLKHNDAISDRLDINAVDSILRGATGLAYINVDATDKLAFHNGNREIMKLGGSQQSINSGNNNWHFVIGNSYINLQDKANLVDRIRADSTSSRIRSVDGLVLLEVSNTGAFYDGSKILTEADKGTLTGVAPLVGGLVPEANLPAYVDDVVEGYLDIGDTKVNGFEAFYVEITLITLITPAASKIYVNMNSNTAYRWSGSAHVAIGTGLVIGELITNAYRGDRGKLAYDHSLEAHDYADTIHAHSTLDSPDGLSDITVANDSFAYRLGAQLRMLFGTTFSVWYSPNGLRNLHLDDSVLTHYDGARTRMAINTTQCYLKSPDGLQELMVDNTGAYYNGSEIGSNSGDVAGPAGAQIDGIAVFATTTGKVIKTVPVLISSTGVLLGVTSMTIDNLKIDGNTVEAVGTDQSLFLSSTGIGIIVLNGNVAVNSLGEISGVSMLHVDNLKLNGSGLSCTQVNGDMTLLTNGTGAVLNRAQLKVSESSSDAVIQATTSVNGGTGLRVKQHVADVATIIDFHTDLGVRKSWFGHGSSSDRHAAFWHNDYSDGLNQVDVQSGGAFKVLHGANLRLEILATSSILWSPDKTRYIDLQNGNNPKVSHSWTVSSDRRLKTSIAELTEWGACAFINGLNPVSYSYNTDLDQKELGFIAQEVEKLQFADIVQTDPVTGMKSMKYDAIISPLVKYAQHLNTKAAVQATTIKAQGELIAAMEKRLTALEAKP